MKWHVIIGEGIHGDNKRPFVVEAKEGKEANIEARKQAMKQGYKEPVVYSTEKLSMDKALDKALKMLN